ncbi:MAG: ATP-binding protein [Cyanobacteria bacterium P01_F01_bin.3]
MLRNRFSYLTRPSLPLRISFPFMLMFLGGWALGGALIGQYFSSKMEETQQEQSAELASLVKREVDRELYNLRRSARLMARDEAMVEGVAQSSPSLVRQEILPMNTILKTDFVTVFGSERQTLVDTKQIAFQSLELNHNAAIDLALTGSDISTIVGTSGHTAPFVIGTAPIKNEQGVVGGIILGTALSDDLLSQINESIQEQIVVIDDGQIVASTFPLEDDSLEWQASGEVSRKIMLAGEPFLAQTIFLDGLDGERFELALLISRMSLIRSQQAVWTFILWLASAGALVTAVVGYVIARRIARPIQAMTEVTSKVVADNNFELQMPVQRQDEIGILSTSVNQLIQWVGDYTDQLELSAQTLEDRVKQRTQELSEALRELRETQTQLIQTEKMSSLGQMVAGIAHEINNPISFIQGNIKPLRTYFEDISELFDTYDKEYPSPTEAVVDKREEIDFEFLLEDVAKILASMKMGTERVRDIVVSLRNFSRLDESTIKDVDLSEGLNSTLLILNHRIKQGVKVIKDYAPLPPVMCSPAQLNQVFTNIIANALDAMFDADSPTKELLISTRVFDDERVQVGIKDTGPGMPDEIIAKIFDPFFTTKPVGKGTGLGLGICYKIVQQHRGTLIVNSEVGSGTEFLITLPKRRPFESLESSDDDEVAGEPVAKKDVPKKPLTSHADDVQVGDQPRPTVSK